MKTIFVLAAVAVAFGLSACGGDDDTESPDAVVRAFLGKLAEGDGEGACELLSDEGREGSLAPICEGGIGPIPDELSGELGETVDDISIETTEETETEATVEASAGDVPGFSFDVGKYGDEWLIDGLAIAEITI